MKLSANTLKLIAVIAMTIDHIAYVFVPPDSVLYFIMRIIGRLTAPLMAFLLVEGFHHTRNRRRYLGRLLVFALISQPFYSLMISGSLNVMYTFAVSLIMLGIVDNKRINVCVKVILSGLCLMLSLLGDWAYWIPIWCLMFYKFRGNFKYQAIAFGLVSAIMTMHQIMSFGIGNTIFFVQFGVLLSLIPMSMYNGKRGGQAKNKVFNAISERGAYIYYPLHLGFLIALNQIL